MLLRSLFACLFLLAGSTALANDEWTTRLDNDVRVAVTPTNQLLLGLARAPNEGTWGYLIIPIKAEQLEVLNKYRTDPLFPYIAVAVSVDKYYRNAQGHILANKLLVKADLDVRQWEGLKKGKRLVVSLPDGSEYKETLKGSNAALAEVEKYFK